MKKRTKKRIQKIIQVSVKTVTAFVLSLTVIATQTQIFTAFEAGVVNVTARLNDLCEPGYSISGVKFNDRNGNAVRNAGEEGLQSWIIVLNKGPYKPEFDFDNSGYINITDKEILRNIVENSLACPTGFDCDFNDDTLVDASDVADFLAYVNSLDLGNKSTAPDGSYSFTGLTEGAYVIYEVLENGWTNTTPYIRYIDDILCGDNKVDFGNFQAPEPFCGDGILQTDRGEECDDGNTQNDDGCDAECKTEVCPGNIVLDFENDSAGAAMLQGQFIDSEYSAQGINIHAHNYNANHPQKAIIFDSDEPSGGINGDHIVDIDLGTPNKMFGGPGDSETGDGSEPSNNTPLHNLLIIPDNIVDTTPADGFVDDPNDEPSGGSIRFVFDAPLSFESIKYIDLDHNSGEVVGYSDVGGTVQAFSIPVAHAGGNAVIKVAGDKTTPIRFLKIRGNDSYAVDEVSLCPTTQVCGNGVVDSGEECDDGNRVNGDGCENTCKATNFCGDGTVQNPNSFGQAELCDNGVLNGTEQSQCTRQCTPKAGQCQALSPGYYKNNDGCSNGAGSSVWADEVNTLSDSFFDVFVSITGEQMCVALADNCTSGSDVDKSRCKAKRHLLADEADVSKSRLRLDALLAGVDDGNAAFDALLLSATSTVSQALSAVEQIVSNSSSTKAQLDRAQYVAMRVYTWYENENPDRPECVLPGLGNGVLETGEECDDGNLIPKDGCSATGTREVVLNEILPDPAGSDNAPKPDGEWVELFNLTDRPISLEGWALYDSVDTHELLITSLNTDTGTTTIDALSHLVVYRDGDGDFSLNNTGDSVRLYTKKISLNGKLIDSFSYAQGKGEGNTFARVPDGTGGWVDPCPTPGDENSEALCIEDNTETPQLQTPIETQADEVTRDEDPPDVIEPAPDAAEFTEEEWLAIDSYLQTLEEKELLLIQEEPPVIVPETTATTTETTITQETQGADTQTTTTEIVSSSDITDATQIPALKDEEGAAEVVPTNEGSTSV